jgi:hypothetical protein
MIKRYNLGLCTIAISFVTEEIGIKKKKDREASVIEKLSSFLIHETRFF